MPQMAPLMWLNLLILTTVMMVIIMIFNYFNSDNNLVTNTESQTLINTKKWLW